MTRVKASSVSMANMLTMSLKDPPQSHKAPENVTMNQFFLMILSNIRPSGLHSTYPYAHGMLP